MNCSFSNELYYKLKAIDQECHCEQDTSMFTRQELGKRSGKIGKLLCLHKSRGQAGERSACSSLLLHPSFFFYCIIKFAQWARGVQRMATFLCVLCALCAQFTRSIFVRAKLKQLSICCIEFHGALPVAVADRDCGGD